MGFTSTSSKLINQTWKNDKKPNFRPDFDPFGPNFNTQIFFAGFISYLFYLLALLSFMQFKGKLINQTWGNGKKH